MRQRKMIGCVLGVVGLVALTGMIAYERSGLGTASRQFHDDLLAAQRAGFELDINRLVEVENRHPNHRSKLAYDRALVLFARRLPNPARKLTVTERRSLRPEIERLVPLSLAAKGGTAREWRLGFNLTFPQYKPYREACRSLVADAEAARTRGDFEEAVHCLEMAESLGHGLSGNQDVLTELAIIGGAARIGRVTALLLSEPRLAPTQVARLARLVQGPTFQHGDDHQVMEHELMLALATVDRAITVPPLRAWKSPSPPDRYGPLGRLAPVREAWLGSIVRPYVDIATALPKDWSQFEAYREAWSRLEGQAQLRGPMPGLYARVLVTGGEIYSDAQMQREALRRVLAYAAASRLGESPSLPRDPFCDAPLRIRTGHKIQMIYSLSVDRKDDRGAWIRGGRGDIAVLIPR